MGETFLIAMIMVSAGVFGGLINYMISGSYDTGKRDERKNNMIKSVVTGVGASFLVPLFLNTISSSLLKDIDSNPYNILVFVGFCIIAAVSSRKFITLISDHLYKQVSEANKNAIEAKVGIEEVKQSVLTITEAQTEPDYHENIRSGNSDTSENDNHYKNYIEDETILTVLANGRYTFRSVNGLSKELEVEVYAISTKLSELCGQGLVRQIQSGGRWFITARGREQLEHFKKEVAS